MIEEQLKRSKSNVSKNMSALLTFIPNQKTIWEMIRKISDKHQPISVRHITMKNSKTTEKEAITNKLAETFLIKSSNKNCKQKFLSENVNAEK